MTVSIRNAGESGSRLEFPKHFDFKKWTLNRRTFAAIQKAWMPVEVDLFSFQISFQIISVGD